MKIKTTLIPAFLLAIATQLPAQGPTRPALAVGALAGQIRLDGRLDEADWQSAPMTDQLRTTVPVEKGEPSARTEIRVLANEKTVVIGIRCEDAEPQGIVRFSKLRDANLETEDHIRIVLDPFLDGQSGYIFAVNANGARYDALVSNRGEEENSDWDAVWEAAASVDDAGWSVEIRLPIQSLNFKKGLTEWGFNVERRIQRKQETIRWANVSRDQKVIQTSRAGLLTHLPKFNYGVGLNVRPSLVGGVTKTGGGKNDWSFEPSLDASQRLGPNVLATVTANTDFAETEVDTRQTNLTRFPLFFPEKRSFFLEGSDIFEFGIGTGSNTVLPFFSRRIGLLRGNEIPVLAGAKLNGRSGKTAFGGLAIRTRGIETPEDTLGAANLGVLRIRQNVWKESSVGMISTFGDPQGRSNAWTSGADFTFQTTRFQGDKNFLVGAWGLLANRDDLKNDRSSAGLKIDYPNDRWDLGFTYARIGENFDPSLGFVPRMGVHYLQGGVAFAPRPGWSWLRQMFNELFLTYVSGLDGQWQSYRIFAAPVNWRLESGDRFEINYNPQGENLSEPFDIAKGVVIPAGTYHFTRCRLEVETAAKRRLNGQLTWWFGSFYEGHLHEIELEANWNPSQLVTFELGGVRNIGRLPWGDFNQTLGGLRVRFNVTPDLQLNSLLQYDTESRELGWNARFHWIFSPLGDAFLVFNHNTLDEPGNRWSLQSRQVLVKVRYNFRV
ncbi:MAG: hypothetical protein EPO28_14505 [Saprospiraceae bacterium]|nr:MAG: hypothetical protein EPO28_14505 [Saprospiraceae bacterium]